MKQRSRVSCVIVLSVAASVVTGCYGPNKLGTDLYQWNMGLSDEKWPREIVFGGLYLTGVYPICSIVDLLVLNSIEFWSSDNPPTAGQTAYTGETIDKGSHRAEAEAAEPGKASPRAPTLASLPR